MVVTASHSNKCVASGELTFCMCITDCLSGHVETEAIGTVLCTL